jgi:DNA-binding transcriptional regulator YbjK
VEVQADPTERRRSPAERRRRIADAALEVLASEGARGLTHRAVDRAAGLPEGSTSNVFRSRLALLEGSLAHHAALDLGAGDPRESGGRLPELSRAEASALVRAGVEAVLQRRKHNVARFELLLESTRREELREQIAKARGEFATRTRQLLTACGCEEPERHTRQLLATLDGVLLADFYGEDHAVTGDELGELIDRFFETC